MKFGKAFSFAKSHSQNFRTEAGTTHAEEQRVFETRFLYGDGNLLQRINVGKLRFGDREPAEPIAFVRSRPQRSIFLPEPRDFIVFFPVFNGRGYRTCKRAG